VYRCGVPTGGCSTVTGSYVRNGDVASATRTLQQLEAAALAPNVIT
jgi:hypothetical protein